jgi:hydrogenase maturation protease
MGPLAASLLADDPRLRGARVLQRHQLTPELAADVAEASVVVLIDVNVVDEAGVVSVRRVDETAGSGSGTSHHADPADVIALARALWDASPAVFIVSVGAESLEVGEDLSAPVLRALPAVVDAVAAIVAEHGVPGSAG